MTLGTQSTTQGHLGRAADMADIRDLMDVQVREHQTGYTGVWYSQFSRNIVDDRSLAYVHIPDIDPVEEYGPLNWEPHYRVARSPSTGMPTIDSTTGFPVIVQILPVKGDAALLLFDNRAFWRLITWWPGA